MRTADHRSPEEHLDGGDGEHEGLRAEPRVGSGPLRAVGDGGQQQSADRRAHGHGSLGVRPGVAGAHHPEGHVAQAAGAAGQHRGRHDEDRDAGGAIAVEVQLAGPEVEGGSVAPAERAEQRGPDRDDLAVAVGESVIKCQYSSRRAQ